MRIDAKHQKNRKKTFQNQFVFSHRFLKDFGGNLDGFWDPSWVSKNGVFWSFSQDASKRRPRGVQEASKSPKSVPRVPQGRPKSVQERPKSVQERPKRAQGTPTVPLEGHFVMYFCAFLWFSMFFDVVLCFFAFFCVFFAFFQLFYPP